MIEFLEVTAKNFLSIGNSEQKVGLCQNGLLTLILGINADQPHGDDAARNGTGKTVLSNAIAYALYGKTISDIRRIGNVVNNINNRNSLVTITFRDANHTYRIERGQKPRIFRWIVDGATKSSDESQDESEEQRGGSRDTQAAINEVLGMDFDMFAQVVAMNTYTKQFHRMQPAEQREFIEQILGIRVMSAKAELLMDRMRGVKRDIELEETKIAGIKTANDQIQKSIDDLNVKVQRWDLQHAEALGEIKGNLDALNGIDFAAEISVFEKQRSYDDRKRELSIVYDALVTEVDILEKEASRILKEIHTLENISTDDRQIDRLHQEYSRLEADIEGADGRLQAEMAQIDRSLDTGIEQATRTKDKRIAQEETASNRAFERLDKDRAKASSDLDAAMAALNDPNKHTCGSCGQSLKDEQHRQEITARLETMVAECHERLSGITNQYDALKASYDAEIEAATVAFDEEIIRLRKMVDDKKHDMNTRHVARVVEFEKSKTAILGQIEDAKSELAERKRQTTLALDVATKSANEISILLTEKGTERDQIRAMISDLGARPSGLFGTIEEAYQAKSLYDQLCHDYETEKSKENPYSEQVAVLRGNLTSPNYDNINKYTRLFEHQKFLRELLIDKKSFIRKRIIDQNSSYLNARLSHYLARMCLPHQVVFQNDLSLAISQYGRELDYGNLSRGETTRLAYSLSWAFRDIWENLNGAFNLVLVDEIIDNGLDPAGAKNAFDILKEVSRTRNKSIFLVTHKEDLHQRADLVLCAKKENKFTTYVTE